MEPVGDFSCNHYLTMHGNALIISGLWPMKISKRLPKSLKSVGYLLDRSLMAFLFLNSFHLAACQVKTVYDKWGSSIDNLYVHGQEYLVAHTMVIITVLFQVYEKEVIGLFDAINNNLRPRSAPGMTYTSMEKCHRLSQNLSLVYIVGCVVGTFHHCMSPLWDGNRRLPAQTWYPFDELKSPYYEVIYALQAIGTLQSGMLYSTIINLSFSISTLMCGQYDLLYCSIHNILHTAMLRRGDKKYVDYLRRKQLDWKAVNKDWVQYTYSEELMERLPEVTVTAGERESAQQDVEQWRSWDKEILYLLNDCTVFHAFIIRIVKQSEECLRYILGAALIHFILLLCLLVFALSRHLIIDNTLWHILLYTSLTYALACLMCYPAHILIYQVGSKNCCCVLDIHLYISIHIPAEHPTHGCSCAMSLVHFRPGSPT